MPMRVVLEVLAGPFTGRRIALRSGQKVTVGRSDRAKHTIPHDSLLSQLHFSLEFEGTRCFISDLNSSNGTLVNGHRITKTLLRNRDEVSAGSTSFVVRYESELQSASSSPEAVLPDADTPEERLLGALRTT